MRILFDQGTPAPLRHALPSHVIETAFDRGWGELLNGELLQAAESEGFTMLITTDKNLRYQQNLSALPIAVAVLVAKSNRIETLRPLIPKLLTSLATLPARTLVQIDS